MHIRSLSSDVIKSRFIPNGAPALADRKVVTHLPAPAKRMVDGQSDAALIQACLAGDQGAWKDLVNQYARLVYSIPLRYGLSTTDADDVFQNVFTIVFRRLPSLRNQTRLAAWLITITHRESLRIRKCTPNSGDLDESIVDVSDPPLEEVQKWERQHMVRRALEQVGNPCRELLTALFLDTSPQTYEKIAVRLGVPVGSIGPTRARCFKKLESLLAAMGMDPSH